MAARSKSVTPIGLLQLLAAFFVGASVTHPTICVINDMLDVDFDAKVGEYMVSYILCVALKLSLRAHEESPSPIRKGFHVICWYLPSAGVRCICRSRKPFEPRCVRLTIISSTLRDLLERLRFRLALIGLFPVHAVYPLMKRVTYLPQVYLGKSKSALFSVCCLRYTERRLCDELGLPRGVGSARA